MRKIPSTMVSQHPDHADKPYWHDKEFITTNHEVKECFLSFFDLGASEYKWDWEGKYVDESVVERLISGHFDYFKNNPLGVNKFLTFRLPNPKVQTEFRLSRAFMGILGASLLTKEVGLPSPSLFEVILPMTESADEMISVQEAFSELASLKHPLHKLENGELKYIEVIPLFEQVQTIIHSNQILNDYLILHKIEFKKNPVYIRPYVARSDPALNSGIVPTVLAIKIALSRYKTFEKETGVFLYPVIGSASLPFRGGLSPINVDNFISEYKGIKTALLQSSFRYDFNKKDVISAIQKLEKELSKNSSETIPQTIEFELRELIPIFELYYRQTIEGLAPIINNIASYLPPRRERVQHIGLFGYSRGMGQVKLPRAIGFTASLYSLGIPPEIIGTGRGLKVLKKLKKLPLLEKYYKNMRKDLTFAGRFVNKDIIKKMASKSNHWQEILQDIEDVEKYLGVEFTPLTESEKEHKKLVDRIHKNLDGKKDLLTKDLDRMAKLRRSLG